MRTLSATDLLKRHAIERRIRSGIKSVNLDRDPNMAVPAMTHGQWVDSCLLMRGVNDIVLAMLEVYYCEDAGSQWTEVLVEIQGQQQEVRVEQVPIRLTLREAAERIGLNITWIEARTAHRKAIAVVNENLCRRATNEGAEA